VPRSQIRPRIGVRCGPRGWHYPACLMKAARLERPFSFHKFRPCHPRQGVSAPIPDQHAHLTAMMRGHYAYYGITGNTPNHRLNAARGSVLRRCYPPICRESAERVGRGRRDLQLRGQQARDQLPTCEQVCASWRFRQQIPCALLVRAPQTLN
jgi:hypothetical protein